MAISSPLPSTAFSAHPLSVVLSLDGPSSGSPPQPASTSSTSAGIDVFDELDAAAGSWAPESSDAPSQDLPAQPRDRSATPSDERTEVASRSATLPSDRDGAEGFVHALSDSHAALYAQGGESGAGEEGGLPGWMSETSGRVTAMASGQLRVSGDCSAHWHAEPPGRGSKRRARPPLRVAVGCEDGRTWIFAPLPSSSSAKGADGSAGLAGARGEDDEGDLRRLSHDSFLSTPSTSSPPSRSPLHSPPLSPSARSRQVFAGTASPRLSSRRSSSSISTLASLQTNATARTKRVSSANASQSSTPGAAMLQSYELVRSHSRPRKASATVSISTSSAVPNHANGASRADDLPDMPLSPPAPSSPPMSPRSPTSVPQLVFSSPSRPPSLPPFGTLHSKKESASSSAAPSISSATPSRRSHSRAKDSIASGIGLWEAPSPSSAEPQPGAPGSSREERTVELSGGEGPHEHAQTAGRDRLGRLEAVLEIRTPGSGPVVALEVVEGLKCADKDEGVALAVLRQSGHLSIVSLLDGRTFGTCDTAVKVPSSSRAEGTRFADLQVANLAEMTVAVCVGAAETKVLVPVDLNTLVAYEPVAHEADFGGSAVVTTTSGPAIVVATSQPQTPASFATFLVAAQAPFISLASSLVVDGTSPEPIKGLRTCGNLVASWTDSNLLVCDQSQPASLCIY
ncbi:uncharacterized protein JCM10292_000396 [Rhodotorula paludigena]|uniref:uncharacterized protein n=1 Tax=Rhodotorula paludigena TaxID=86838 RepID=UPI00317C2A8C